MTEVEKLIIQLKAVRQQAEFTFQHNPVGFTLTYGTYWEYVSKVDETISVMEKLFEKTKEGIHNDL